MAEEKKWICKKHLKETNEVVELQLFHMNFREAIYMCSKDKCPFPLDQGREVFNYIVEHIIEIDDSDLDSEVEVADVETKNLLRCVAHGILPAGDEISIPSTSGVLNNMMCTCQPGENADVTALSYGVSAPGQHTNGSDSCLESSFLNSDCVLDNFEIHVDEAKSFYDETVFTSLVSELAACAENVCELPLKHNVPDVSDPGTCKTEITEEKSLNICQFLGAEKSDGGTTKGNNASQLPRSHSTESETAKEKTDVCQVPEIQSPDNKTINLSGDGTCISNMNSGDSGNKEIGCPYVSEASYVPESMSCKGDPKCNIKVQEHTRENVSVSDENLHDSTSLIEMCDSSLHSSDEVKESKIAVPVVRERSVRHRKKKNESDFLYY